MEKLSNPPSFPPNTSSSCISSSQQNKLEDEEPFTEEQLVVIDAIEASYTSPLPPTTFLIERHASRCQNAQELEDDRNTHKISRRLPLSISSSAAARYRPFWLSRCQVSPRRYPAMRFGGRILYSRTASEVNKAAMQLLKILETKRGEAGRAVLGFDIEWKPSFKRGVRPGKVAVMQICVDNNYCHVMHIIHSGIPESLQYLLEDSTLLKVGVGIVGDSVKLFHDYGVSIKDIGDLSDLANQKLGGDSRKWSLASLTETLVCKELAKPNKIRLGNWEVNVLSKEKLQYAATDAFASWHLYEVLKNRPDALQDASDKPREEAANI